MNSKITPSAWAELRAYIYRYGGITIFLAACLGQLDLVSTADAMTIIAILIPVVLLAGIPHVWGHISGNVTLVRTEAKAWAITSPTVAYPAQLRERGAIGVDLVAHAHRQQSAGRQSGHRKAGGHKKPASSSSSDDSDGGEPPASLPLLCMVHDLAVLLQVSPKTLQNKPQSALPPAVFIPGCRGPRYHLRDVIAWVNSFPVGGMKPPRKPTGKRGRPRIATSAQIAAVRGKGV